MRRTKCEATLKLTSQVDLPNSHLPVTISSNSTFTRRQHPADNTQATAYTSSHPKRRCRCIASNSICSSSQCHRSMDSHPLVATGTSSRVSQQPLFSNNSSLASRRAMVAGSSMEWQVAMICKRTAWAEAWLPLDRLISKAMQTPKFIPMQTSSLQPMKRPPKPYRRARSRTPTPQLAGWALVSLLLRGEPSPHLWPGLQALRDSFCLHS